MLAPLDLGERLLHDAPNRTPWAREPHHNHIYAHLADPIPRTSFSATKYIRDAATASSTASCAISRTLKS